MTSVPEAGATALLEFLHGNAGESQTACTMVQTLIVPSQQIYLAVSRAYIRGSNTCCVVASFPLFTGGAHTMATSRAHVLSVLKRRTQLPVRYNVMCLHHTLPPILYILVPRHCT